jgi:cystathionine beta-lyase
MKQTRTSSNIDTRLIHNGADPHNQGGMVNPPVYHGSTVVYQSLEELEKAKSLHGVKDALVYGRFGNASTFALENAYADLESAWGALSVSSGLAAITTTLLALADSGDHILVADTVYGPTRAFCLGMLTNKGIEVDFYDPCIGAEIEQLIRPTTRLIYIESPGSITFEVQDVPAVVKVAQQCNIVTVVDNSWATPVFYRPIEHGVNVVVTAGTKYVVGHSDAMVGLIAADEAHYTPIRKARDLLGQILAPDDVYLAMRGLRTLGVRIRQHQKQALRLVDWLESHPSVIRILHPAHQDCAGHALWQRDFEGASGLFAFVMKKRSRKALSSMLDNMQLFSMGFSWGGFESLIVPQNPASSRSSTHWDENDQVFRIHTGLESIEDLIQDLESGIDRYLSID